MSLDTLKETRDLTWNPIGRDENRANTSQLTWKTSYRYDGPKYGICKYLMILVTYTWFKLVTDAAERYIHAETFPTKTLDSATNQSRRELSGWR